MKGQFFDLVITDQQAAAADAQTAEKAMADQTGSESRKQRTEHPVYRELQTLQANTGARSVILLSASGYPMETAGQTGGLDIATVSALVATNFIASAELAKLLGRGSIFKSSYHEGQDGTNYNIYAYDVNGEYLLAVVFGLESKPGVVWFYTKQSAASLARLLSRPATVSAGKSEPAAGADPVETGSLMTVEQAIAAGLLPAEFSQSGKAAGQEHPLQEMVFQGLEAIWSASSPTGQAAAPDAKFYR